MKDKVKYDEIVLRQDEIFFICGHCGRRQYESECEPSLFCAICGRMVCSHCHEANTNECNDCAEFGIKSVPAETDE